MLNSIVFFRLLVGAILVATSKTLAQDTISFTGIVSIGCTDGSCIFLGDCDSLSDVPGDQEPDNDDEYTNINGEIRLTPATCQANCTGCIGIPGSDEIDDQCIATAGYVWCPELEDCIRPWSTNCPFEGDTYIGPAAIDCTNGRCNDLSEDCAIEIGSAVVGGPYLSGMEGMYNLSEGCTATCQGCTCDDCTEVEDESSSSTIPLAFLFLSFSTLCLFL